MLFCGTGFVKDYSSDRKVIQRSPSSLGSIHSFKLKLDTNPLTLSRASPVQLQIVFGIFIL